MCTVSVPLITAYPCACVYVPHIFLTNSFSCNFPPPQFSFSFLFFFGSLSQSLPPLPLFSLFSLFFSLPLAHSHQDMHPSIRPRMQLARVSPQQAARLGMVLCKEIQKLLRHHCLMVSPWQLREQGPARRVKQTWYFEP